MNIYQSCPTLESQNYIIRLFDEEDCNDLLKVYSDKKALPFFNSDNCDGDNFYYPTIDKMNDVLKFWQFAYDNGWFVRLSIENKTTSTIIGTVELCKRKFDDNFNNMVILRIDLRSDYEKEDVLYELITLIEPNLKTMIGGNGVITKGCNYAIERIKALQKAGFKKSEQYLIGKTGYLYDGYWQIDY